MSVIFITGAFILAVIVTAVLVLVDPLYEHPTPAALTEKRDTPTAMPMFTAVPITPTPVAYENCPAFDGLYAYSDPVTLHPDLVEDTIRLVREAMMDSWVVAELGIRGKGEPLEVSVDNEGVGDGMHAPRYELPDGRQLYYNIHLWGWAEFADDFQVDFHVWVKPAPASSGKLECEVEGVGIKHGSFVPI